MATDSDINREYEDISKVWGNPQARNGLFGNILKSISVQSCEGNDGRLGIFMACGRDCGCEWGRKNHNFAALLFRICKEGGRAAL